MKRAFVIGHPIKHSRSPLIHRPLAGALWHRGQLRGHRCRAEDLPGFFERLRAANSPAATSPSRTRSRSSRSATASIPLAEHLGAVNTLAPREQPATSSSAAAIPTSMAFSAISTSARRAGMRTSTRRSCWAPGARLGPSPQRSISGHAARSMSSIAAWNGPRRSPPNWAAVPGRCARRLCQRWPQALASWSTPPRSACTAPAFEGLALDLLPATALVTDIVYVPLDNAAPRRRARPGSAHRRWPRHAAASGRAGLRGLVRRRGPR